MELVANPAEDGIYGMLPQDLMVPAARKLRDTYAITPGAPIIQQEFGFFSLERWYEEGLDRDADLTEVFGFDPNGDYALGDLGWCEAAFCPEFERVVLDDRGDHEVIQDHAGRSLLVFRGRRDGFMPTYLDHPVKDRRTWEEKCRWRLDPATPERWEGFDEKMRTAQARAREGLVIVQGLVGGYMYLRSLFGPEEIMYALYDQTELVHDCMKAWFELSDNVIARHQRNVTIEVLFLAEDICYNHGLLCSPAMMREFLLPYYKQLIANVRSRQLDPARRLRVMIDTDGNIDAAIRIYRDEIAMDIMTPFEVASGSDVVAIGKQYPNIVMKGGIDKRVLSQGPPEIDRMVERIIPAMRERGGYIPTCDHGVPAEVSLANYHHYRKRCIEIGG